MVKVQAHFHHNRDGIYIGEGRIPELLGVHIVGYEGRIPSLKRLLICEVILISLRWLRYKHIFIIIAMAYILAREEFRAIGSTYSGLRGKNSLAKRLLIRKVIYSRIQSHLPLRWLPSCDLLDKEVFSMVYIIVICIGN